MSKVAGATPTFLEQFLEDRWLLRLLQPAILVLTSCCSLIDIILVLMLREVAPVRCCWVLITAGILFLLLLISTHPLLLGTQSGEERFAWRHASRREEHRRRRGDELARVMSLEDVQYAHYKHRNEMRHATERWIAQGQNPATDLILI